MPWRASGSSARWSAPGRWSVVNENAVRHWPSRRSSRVYGAMETKRVYASGWSPTFPSMIVEAVDAGGPVARDRDHGWVCRGRPRRRRVTGRRRGDRASRWAVEASSLRHWSSATGCEWISRTSSSATSAGPTRQWLTGQDRLGHDRERRFVEEVVGLGDRPDERALDRQHAVGDAPRRDGLDDVRERRERDEASGREEPVAGGGGVCAFAAGVGDGEFVGCHVRSAPFGGDESAGDSASRRGADGRRRRLARKGEAEGRAGESGASGARRIVVTAYGQRRGRATRRRRPRTS